MRQLCRVGELVAALVDAPRFSNVPPISRLVPQNVPPNVPPQCPGLWQAVTDAYALRSRGFERGKEKSRKALDLTGFLNGALPRNRLSQVIHKVSAACGFQGVKHVQQALGGHRGVQGVVTHKRLAQT